MRLGLVGESLDLKIPILVLSRFYFQIVQAHSKDPLTLDQGHLAALFDWFPRLG